MNNSYLKDILDAQLASKNTIANLYSQADPLQIASKFKDPFIALICALFAYGNAKMIVKFLNSLDFDMLNLSDDEIRRIVKSKNFLYRFQNSSDVSEIFITIKRLKEYDLQGILLDSFNKRSLMVDAINELIAQIYKRGFDKEPKSPYKRYNMWLRWMVRDSDIDLGLFKSLPKSELILPLDTHTHKVSLELGLCDRKSYDYKAALCITSNLKIFDSSDPVKYDFALYRIGQSKELERVKSGLNKI
ncbi:MAG: TIGR02757 family protein [Campylobacter hyointestinalis]